MSLIVKPLLLALAGSALVCSVAAAQAVDTKRGNEILKKYCTGDYLSYCSAYNPNDPATDACFKANWRRISENCRRAIDAYAPPPAPPARPSRKRG